MHAVTHGEPPALLVDFGGVLSGSVMGAFERACRKHGVEPRGFIGDVFSQEHADDSCFALIELGLISIPDFVEQVTSVLSRHAGGHVDGAAWFSDVQGTTQQLDPRMVEAVQALFERGVQTALLSNSWGLRDTYPWDEMPEFCAVVISGEVGIRKPDSAIYELAARKLGRAPDECLFIDDVEVNLVPARRLGMNTILHHDADATLRKLRDIYG